MWKNAAGALALALFIVGCAHAEPAKVLRYAARAAETGFDPAQVTDKYSRDVCANIFDTPLHFDALDRPVRLVPAVLTALPEQSEDDTRHIFRIKPGIYFADDAAFKGAKRELTGADLVYTLLRHFDPRWKSGHLFKLEAMDLLGLNAYRKKVLAERIPFDYSHPFEGVVLKDRYTVEIHTGHPEPRLGLYFADPMMGLVAREVVEFYGDRIMAHPVGTNAWRLVEWRRSSRMVLEKNPNFRETYYAEKPPADDPVLAAQVRALQGRRLPLIDRVEISVIEENQPRYLSFLRKEFDLLEELPNDFAPQAIPHDRIAASLAKSGMRAVRYSRSDVTLSYFNMEDPVVGGYTPQRVALRRAISLAYDVSKQIRVVRRGQAVPAQGLIADGLSGYDAGVRTLNSQHDLPAAKALLDLYGYVDRDGDGWREQPDGKPLVLEVWTQPEDQFRQLAEIWQKAFDALGVKVKFRFAKFPDNLKAANAGRLQMWSLAWSADVPDGENLLALAYGPSFSNKARFRLPEFDALFERLHRMPDGPQRLAAMQRAQALVVAYMPYRAEVHRQFTDLVQPWLLGFSRSSYVRDYWSYVDIDTARQPRTPQ
ncbi:MAG: bicyclomycin resistance protein [Paucibacter sp.]|nr:bicyclomycin resistance protein [Roseateles sp.]